jgi:hypothetical protein
MSVGKEKGKKYFIISARVHPAETVSSFVLDGFLNFILCEHDPRAALLRSKFVFKIIPMLNPDGCVRGNYRDDSRGVNLNRVYDYPQKQFHPTIYAVKKYIVDICAASGDIGFYIDLHGHANKPGCFLFANKSPSLEARNEIWNFGKKMKEYCPWFDLRECDFTADNGSSKSSLYTKNSSASLGEKEPKTPSNDVFYKTKEGTARVAIQQATQCHHIYTFETNYHSARHGMGWIAPIKHAPGFPFGNYCPPAVKCMSLDCVLGASIQHFSKEFQPSIKENGFTMSDLHSMGRSLALSALDVIMKK